MSATGEMFLQMRANEIVQMYDSTFTKKEAIKTGIELVENVFESGEVSPEEVMANISRLKWVVDSVDTAMRSRLEIFDKRMVLGLEFSFVSGGNTVNYSDDEIYNVLKSDLDARVELLKLAQKQSVIDMYGNDVPVGSTTPRKSSITIKF